MYLYFRKLILILKKDTYAAIFAEPNHHLYLFSENKKCHIQGIFSYIYTLFSKMKMQSC